MARELDAYMDGALIGRFTMSSGGAIRFDYDDRWPVDGTPLSLSMPRTRAAVSGAAPGVWLDGLLPDNDLVREALARRFQVSSRSPFRILEHTGRDTAGAMQLVPPGEAPDDDPSRAPAGTPLSGDDIAEHLRRIQATYSTGAPPPADALRLSIAGAQPKLVLARSQDAWHLPKRGVASTHIFKPEVDVSEHIDSIDIAERVTMGAARTLGLDVATTEAWVSPDGSLRALVIERYDRVVGDDGGVRRLHQEDLLQAMALPSSKKYQDRDGGPGVAQIAALIETKLLRADRHAIARAFFDALVFNIAAVCTDAHAKNYSLLLQNRSVRLAPLYDLVSVAGYTVPGALPRSAMKIGEEYSLHSINAHGLAREAKRLGISDDEAYERIRSIVERLPDAFSTSASALASQGIAHPLIARTVDGVANTSPLIRGLDAIPRHRPR